VWWARLLDLSEPGTAVVRALVAVLSDEFPAGTSVDLPGPGRPAGWQLAIFADDVGRTSRIETHLPDAPLLWYVELPEADAEPPATTLLAFSDDRYPEGTLLSAAEARAGGIGGAEQVAAIRWWPRSGLVHQLFVGPAHRRRGVAGKLGYVAFGLQAVRGLPELHGDGRRTRLGEQFRQGLPEYAAARMAPWSSELPPMDL
jgi:GNAT superfamily N-acetyltransferase